MGTTQNIGYYSLEIHLDSLKAENWLVNKINKKYQASIKENLDILNQKAYNKALVKNYSMKKNDSTMVYFYQPHAYSSEIGIDLYATSGAGGTAASIVPTKNFTFIWGDGMVVEIVHDTAIASVYTVPAKWTALAKMPALNINSASFEKIIRAFEQSPAHFAPVKLPNGDVQVVTAYFGNRRSNRLDLTSMENGKLKTKNLFTSASPNKGWRCDPVSAFVTEEGDVMCIVRKGFRKVTLLKVEGVSGKPKKRK
jgi:hypothetical protein